jgi:Xaa-Pro aminopeptidase
MTMKNEEFSSRRQRLLDSLGDDIYIRLSNYEHQKNSDVHFNFRQDSSFFYLTEFPETDSLLILDPQAEDKFCLFVLPKDRTKEMWEGFRYGCEGAVETFKADASWENSKIAEVLANRIQGRNVQFTPHKGHPLNSEVEHTIATHAGALKPDMSNTFIARMRMIKSPWEIEQMRRAAEISCNAHNALLRKSSELNDEAQMEAEYLYNCMMNGVKDQAYPPIVAGGANATCLHYRANDQVVNPDDLVLIDAGSSWNNYAADITRTFPKNGKFTEDKKAIYEAVLHTQKKTIEAVKPGISIKELHALSCELISQQLIDLKFIKGPLEKAVEEKLYTEFFPHYIGHHLGLDVHDCDGVSKEERGRSDEFVLKAGMVITIEPGIYVQPDNENLSENWLGIGVRIEDDILVTEEGCDNLTESALKEISDIEN